MKRITADAAFMGVAYVLSLRASCARRKVGCVLVDARNHIIGTGYNGVAAGDPHCTDVPCAGAGLPSGTGLDKCEAIHAEQNALEQCQDVWEIDTLYCTTLPCMHCAKMLRNTSLRRVVYLNSYPHAEEVLAYFEKGHVLVSKDASLSDARPEDFMSPPNPSETLKRRSKSFLAENNSL